MTSSLPPVVFLGPTMDHCTGASLAEADFKPPAAMGDVTRAVAAGVSAIVLVDGVFESGPSVWHKEILLALADGIPVIGASSMGALRAAELADYGMWGFGKIFEDFASGLLEDDDEVAVAHGPAETGWMQLSDALVDIRASAAKAVACGVLPPRDAGRLIADAKATFFKDRSLLEGARTVLPQTQRADEVEDVVRWFQAESISQKRLDCQALLESLPGEIANARQKMHLASGFEPTAYLRRLREFGYRRPQESQR